MERTTNRPLRVGVQLPEIEPYASREWDGIAALARAVEGAGFDSLWLGDHFLYRQPDGSVRAPWDAWSLMPAIAAITSRVTIGPLVTPLGFYNPAVLAKKAATLDEISGGRFVLGVGAGWNRDEFDAYGVPFDHRFDRFEESFTILRTLLRDGAIDFEGRYASARDCVLVPAPPPGRPPLMVGSVGERMLSITLPYAASWNVWYSDTGNSPAGVAPLRDRVAEACERAGRDPTTVEATVCALVQLPGGTGRYMGGGIDPTSNPVQGPPEAIADELRAYASAGVAEVMLVVDPITIASIERLAPVLELLDRG